MPDAGTGATGGSRAVIDVVMRCRNEMPFARHALEALARQENVRARVLFVDCESIDGSREAAVDFGVRIHDITAATYVPGAVLNAAMAMTETPVVAFINADAVALDDGALAALIAPFHHSGDLAATYARQVPRRSADRVTRADYARAFPDDQNFSVRFGAFFSMAASAIRRTVWQRLQFDPHLRYSEDVDWVYRLMALGWRTEYVPGARFEHSHAYSLAGHYRRRRGEGQADGLIYRLGRPHALRDLVRPLGGSLGRDTRAARLSVGAVGVRVAQATGYFSGRRRAFTVPDRPYATASRAHETSYTLCGDVEVERRIEDDVATINRALVEELGAGLCGLLLVGGYARGEGSVVERSGRLSPYNDYDLIAVVERGSTGLRRRLASFAETWTRKLAISVDIWPIVLSALPRVPPTLFWLDVSLGGVKIVGGDPGILKRIKAWVPRQIALEEMGRLLANRAVGLALSRLQEDNRDFQIARHGHKAVIACGDARLLAADRYAGSLAERLEELERLRGAPSIGDELVAAYRDAVDFRRRPDQWRAPEPLPEWFRKRREQVATWHLTFEAWRVQSPPSADVFAMWPGRLFPRLADVRTGGSAAAALRAAAEGSAPLKPWFGHPRERLARAAAALAYGSGDQGNRTVAAHLLGVPANTSDEVLTARLRALAGRGQ